MKLSNFRFLQEVHTSAYSFVSTAFAKVTVTTGALWWKRSWDEEIACRGPGLGGFWFFTRTGQFTPEYQAERLYRVWQATEGVK